MGAAWRLAVGRGHLHSPGAFAGDKAGVDSAWALLFYCSPVAACRLDLGTPLVHVYHYLPRLQ